MIRFLRHFIVDDFLLKLFSLVLALLFWFVVSFAIQEKEGPTVPTLSLTPEVRVIFRLPVVAMSPTADGRKFKVTPDEVDVVLQGETRLMQTLQSRDFRAMVELTGSEGAHNLSKKVVVSVPAGVTFLRATPEEVQVYIPPKP